MFHIQTVLNFSESYSSHHISSSSIRRQHPSTSGQQSVSFRSSLPDLSSQADGKSHRRSFKSMQHHKSSSGYRLAKKSSSDDDDTSSLIDLTERSIRSSIDLLLTDDLQSMGADFSYRNYSSRRTNSQPILNGKNDHFCIIFIEYIIISRWLWSISRWESFPTKKIKWHVLCTMG
jgi:hypothetical protein